MRFQAKKHFRLLRLSIAVVASVCFAPPADAGNGKSSWGWAKPLNQRLGAFHTVNKAHHRQFSQPRRTLQSSVFQSRRYQSYRYSTPTPRWSTVPHGTGLLPSTTPTLRPTGRIPFRFPSRTGFRSF